MHVDLLLSKIVGENHARMAGVISRDIPPAKEHC